MKCTVLLSDAERKTLQQLSLNHPHRDCRTRAAGIMLLARLGRVRDVAHELDVTSQSLYNWVHAWRVRGLCGLPTGHKGGRPPALSEAMIATAIDAASAQAMTLAQIARYVETIHEVPLPCRMETLAQALKAGEFICQRSKYLRKQSSSVDLSADVYKMAEMAVERQQ